MVSEKSPEGLETPRAEVSETVLADPKAETPNFTLGKPDEVTGAIIVHGTYYNLPAHRVEYRKGQWQQDLDFSKYPTPDTAVKNGLQDTKQPTIIMADVIKQIKKLYPNGPNKLQS